MERWAGPKQMLQMLGQTTGEVRDALHTLLYTACAFCEICSIVWGEVAGLRLFACLFTRSFVSYVQTMENTDTAFSTRSSMHSIVHIICNRTHLMDSCTFRQCVLLLETPHGPAHPQRRPKWARRNRKEEQRKEYGCSPICCFLTFS